MAPGEMGGAMPGPTPEAAPSEEEETEAKPAEDAQAAVEEGLKLKEEGNLEEAEKKFRSALAADENNLLAHWGLGTVLVELGKAAGDQEKIEEGKKELQTFVKLAKAEQEKIDKRVSQAAKTLRQLGVKVAVAKKKPVRRARRVRRVAKPTCPYGVKIVDEATGSAVTYTLETPGVPAGMGQ